MIGPEGSRTPVFALYHLNVVFLRIDNRRQKQLRAHTSPLPTRRIGFHRRALTVKLQVLSVLKILFDEIGEGRERDALIV